MQGRRTTYVMVTLVVVALIGWLIVRQMGKSQLLHTLSSPDLKARTAAASKLLDMDKLADALPAQPIIVRSKTAQALGEIGSDEALKVLGEILKDQEEAPRRWARQALVKQGLRALPVLLANLSATGGTRDEVITALKQIGPSAAPFVRFFLSDGSTSANASLALSQLGEPGIETLLRASICADGDLRAAALDNLGLQQVKAAVPNALENLGSDPNAQKGAAIKALGLIGDPSATPAILPFLTDAGLRETAVTALGLLGDGRAVEPIIGTLGLTEKRYRNATILALRRIGPPAYSALVRTLTSPEVLKREAAAESLIGSSSAGINSALAAALKDEDDIVRAGVASALGWKGNAAAVPALVGALNDPSWRVVDAAVGALGNIGTGAIGNVLALLRSSSNETVQYQLARSLAAMGNSAVPSLINALSEANPTVQKWSAVALGDIGDQRATEALQRLAQSQQPSLQWIAKEQLRKLQAVSGI